MNTETLALIEKYGSHTCVKSTCRKEYVVQNPELEKLVLQIFNLTESYYDDQLVFAVADLIQCYTEKICDT